eukprot:TRINITY_DN7970_c0_g1_i1.p1 TRINITY_DN7970_c0_g1~~TRINITY_DN7970_c0_g1_i1.p1  ORF type:complete len:510 (+),score=113.02 TRINITY_DN7970_c0_g1_i1:84-1613(+)
MALNFLVTFFILGLPVTRSLNAVVVQRQQWGALGNALKNVASTVVGAVADGLDSLENLFGRAILGDVVVDDFQLQGNDMAERNVKVAICFGSVALAGMVGWIADRSEHGRRRSAEEATSYFWLAILGISYILLVPGLVSTLFMFLMGIQVLGLKILVTNVDGEPSQITESALGFIGLLFETGGVLGAALIILYAIVVPVVKLGLLVVAELWRGSEDVAKVRSARKYIGIVQLISKWACPDMFAYILIMYLFKSINMRGGDVLYTPAELGLGFSCFSIFCVGSTFATMAVNMPKLRDEQEEDRSPPIAVRWIGLERLPWVTAVLLVTFLGLFLPGLVLPAMGVHLETELLLEPNGPVPQIAKPILDSLGLEEKVNGTVSMVEATRILAIMILDGDLNDIIAIIMMAVFAMLLPLIDMLILMRIALQMSSTSQGDATPKLMKVTKWLKHICMMDVALMGVIVITFAGAAYSAQGIVFKLMTGIWVLLGAEVVHYFTYYLVHDAASWRIKTA